MDDLTLSKVIPKLYFPDSEEANIGYSESTGAIVLFGTRVGDFPFYCYNKPEYVFHFINKDVKEVKIEEETQYKQLVDKLKKVSSFHWSVYRHFVDGEVYSVESIQRESTHTNKTYYLVKMTDCIKEFNAKLIVIESSKYPKSWVYSRYVRLKNIGVVLCSPGISRSFLRLKLIEELNIISSSIELEELKQDIRPVETQISSEVKALLEAII